MKASKLCIECVPFDQLKDVIVAASTADADWTSPQFEYLQSYLRGDRPARTLIVETPYVDRHYLEEYGAYYFSALRNGGSTTTRVHVFADEFDRAQLDRWLLLAASADHAKHREVHDRLEDSYLGFLIVRPIASAPIGRTILGPYENKSTRSYIPAEGGHTVHLLGFELHVRGLPFQQQEQAVGACATTALWSALSRVIRADGGRAPTPYAVTQAATRHYLQDRSLPATSGLELAQLTSAVRELGYSPYVLKPAGEHATFALSLKCYLRSGIPGVLVLEDERGGYHAVTASGYRIEDDEELAPDLCLASGETVKLCSRGFTRLYVHDDRFGPYVRMRLVLGSGEQDLRLQRVGAATGDPVVGAGGKVAYALFPLYPKLRLTARELFEVALELLPAVRHLLDADERTQLNVEAFFMLGGTYQKQMLAIAGPMPERIVRFVSEVSLPRYVGVVRFQLGEGALVDVLVDTTDIRRDYPRSGAILSVFPFADAHVSVFDAMFRANAPWVLVF